MASLHNPRAMEILSRIGHICLSRWWRKLFLCVSPDLGKAGDGETVGATALPHAWGSLHQPLLGTPKVKGLCLLNRTAWPGLPPAGSMHIITP